MGRQGTCFTIESVKIGSPMPQGACACALCDTLSTEEGILSVLVTYRRLSLPEAEGYMSIDLTIEAHADERLRPR